MIKIGPAGILLERLSWGDMARIPPDARLAIRLAALLGASAAVTAGHLLDAAVRGANDRRRGAFVRLWGSAVLRSLNVRMLLAPRPLPARPEQATLVVANHRSMVDIPIILSLFGGRLLSRGDIAHWPVFGRMAALAGTIFVERGSARSGATAVESMRICLAQSGVVCVFPEGTTFVGDTVRRFRSGAFAAASRENAAIVPVGIAYADEASAYGDESFAAHARRVASAPVTEVSVVVGEPLPAFGRPARTLADDTRQTVQELVLEARARTGGAKSGPRP
jgi:1-acyl-sn-glycerol-3-phosphate acyltransferase